MFANYCGELKIESVEKKNEHRITFVLSFFEGVFMRLFSTCVLATVVSLNCLFTEGNAAQKNVFSDHDRKVQKTAAIEKKSNKKIHSIVLYINPACPYCKKVLSALNQLGKTIEIIDVSQDKRFVDQLIKIGGKKQVPCIVINGKAMYESSEIVQWLVKNKDLY